MREVRRALSVPADGPVEVELFLGDALRELHAKGGSLFGVCNGFQALMKAGLLPGVDGVDVSLSWNGSHRFECRWSRMRQLPQGLYDQGRCSG